MIDKSKVNQSKSPKEFEIARKQQNKSLEGKGSKKNYNNESYKTQKKTTYKRR